MHRINVTIQVSDLCTVLNHIFIILGLGEVCQKNLVACPRYIYKYKVCNSNL